MKNTLSVCFKSMLWMMLLVPGHVAADPADPVVLAQASDPQLQLELERCLDRLGLAGAVRDKRLTVSLVDITDRDEPHVAAVNGDLMMYSASLPKIAILFGAFQRIEEGSLTLDQELTEDMTAMIRFSSNAAATRMFERVGPQYLQQLLQSDQYRFYDARGKGGLWVGKGYGKGPAYKRDPLFSLSHGATAMQVARYYYLLATGRLVSGKASKAMKEILGNPGLNHKFVGGLKKVHPEAVIYRKSGTWQTYHSDSALIERDGRTYIAVALANDPDGGEWLSRLIVEMDKTIFNYRQDVQLAGLARDSLMRSSR